MLDKLKTIDVKNDKFMLFRNDINNMKGNVIYRVNIRNNRRRSNNILWRYNIYLW